MPIIVSDRIRFRTYFIITGAYLQYKKKLAPFLYKYLGLKIASCFQRMISFITAPFLRVAIIALLLLEINLSGTNVWLSVGILFLSASLLRRPAIKISFDPLPKFSDDFSDSKRTEKSWVEKTSKIVTEKDFGKPAPDLGLKYTGMEATNTFLYLKDVVAENGIVECDVYLEPGAVFNLVFLADLENDNWYMARLDTRQRNSDGFVIKKNGRGANWRELSMAGITSMAKEWIRMRLEFNSTKATLYKNNQPILEIQNLNLFGKKIGIFNELADVHVDNFAFTQSQLGLT